MVIAANTELRERELIKLASLAGAIARALRERGVGDPAASLTAEAGIAVFRVAFERWTDDSTLMAMRIDRVDLEAHVLGPEPADGHRVVGGADGPFADRESQAGAGLPLDDAGRDRLQLLFAPTGALQETSLSSGWGEEFVALATRFDDAV